MNLKSYFKQQDLRAVAIILLAVWAGLVFSNILTHVAARLTYGEWGQLRHDHFHKLAYITYKMWLPWVVCSPFILFLVKKYPVRPLNWVKSVALHLMFALILTSLHLAYLSYSYHFFEENKPAEMVNMAGWEHIAHFLVQEPFFLINLMIYSIFITAFNLSNFYNLVKQKELATSRLEANLAASKLQALQMQVNPHFLFNTLNSISVLVRKKDLDTASQMILRLSDFFRMTLEKTNNQWVPLESELQLVDHYLAIEQVRFKDRLTVVKDIDHRCLVVAVPAMILQPLIENALKHGIGAKEGAGVINLSCHVLADRLVMEVSDNGPGSKALDSPGFRQGVGLSNVRARLQQLYGNDHVFQYSTSDSGVTVIIEIPNEKPVLGEAGGDLSDSSEARIPTRLDLPSGNS